MSELSKRKLSPRKAIALHCRGCIYDKHAHGSCLQQIMDCPIKTCELYEFRPQRKTRTIKNDLPEQCQGFADINQGGTV